MASSQIMLARGVPMEKTGLAYQGSTQAVRGPAAVSSPRNISLRSRQPVAPKAWWSNNVVERSVLHYTNKERARFGLRPLKADRHLTRSASAHSRWMARTGKFSHEGGGNSNPSDRARGAGYGEGAGENIWWVSSQNGRGRTWKSRFHWNGDWELGKAAVISWMNSPGHRANILKSDYRHLGVGVAKNKRGAYYLTQNFGQKNVVSNVLRMRSIWSIPTMLADSLVNAVWRGTRKKRR